MLNNRITITAILISFMLMGCDRSDNNSTDEKKYERSYEIGATAAFSELINAGVKQLGLGVPMVPEEMDKFMDYAVKSASKHDVLVYREDEIGRASCRERV